MTNPKMSEVSFQNLPPMKMACYQVVSREPEDEGGKFMDAWIEARDLQGGRRFGFDVPVTAEQARAGIRGYEQWHSVPNDVTGADGVMVRSFPGGRYAVLRLFDPFTAPFETIPAGWRYLHEWMQSHPEIKCGYHPCLEELVPGEAGGMDLILYYPIG
ncbi:transcriptional regulator, effector-binding domain/component [Longilinea arvoryzae]|uniref:Transcriptional regulator, effector-binding domain/component n=1 Tax=Longilinea arvoryzae TaxID=360412 RepID=A0A0S7BCW2_9CHLR|nr:effector binding domain-containing protein [Longilinea arvoryzae]GAP13097.1 transcriptional regulator, effector-binding domain/component [Longilinea arvoryzae]